MRYEVENQEGGYGFIVFYDPVSEKTDVILTDGEGGFKRTFTEEEFDEFDDWVIHVRRFLTAPDWPKVSKKKEV